MKNNLMTHMVAGYPSYNESQNIFKILDKYSEYIELQFPFSDPIADGPVIEKANEISLENGSTTKKAFDFLEEIIPKAKSKVLIMTYYNIILNYEVEDFIKKSKKLGVYGFIVPDIPFDEEDGKKFIELCKKHCLHLIQIVSPNTKKDRLKMISKISTGFIYAISQNMTTGSKTNFDKKFEDYIIELRKYFNLQIGVGFGVKTKEDIEKVCKIADFAIIGSELIKVYNDSKIEGLEKYFKEHLKN